MDVFIDASYNTNTKIGSMGIYVKDKIEYSLSKCFVCLDSNKAEEYCFLYLLKMETLKDYQIRVFTDNRLLFEKYKNDLNNISIFNNIFEIIWIPRYLNIEADKLASKSRKLAEEFFVEYQEIIINTNKKIVNDINQDTSINNYLINKINSNNLILSKKRKNKIISSLNNKNFDISTYDLDLKYYFLKILNLNKNHELNLLNVFKTFFSSKYIKKNIYKNYKEINNFNEVNNIKKVLISILSND